MVSAYELLAKLFGTKPIHIRLDADVFLFSQGDSRTQITPVVWHDRADFSGRIVAVGDQSPPANAVPVHLITDRSANIQ